MEKRSLAPSLVTKEYLMIFVQYLVLNIYNQLRLHRVRDKVVANERFIYGNNLIVVCYEKLKL